MHELHSVAVFTLLMSQTEDSFNPDSPRYLNKRHSLCQLSVN